MKALYDKGDVRSIRAATNLADLCQNVSVQEIKINLGAQKCLGPSAKIFTEGDDAVLNKVFDQLGNTTLKVLLPSIVRLLDSAPAAAVAILLVPENIGKDALDTVSNPQRNSREDLIAASRSILWDTNPPSFRKLSRTRKATLLSCLVS